MTNFEYAYEDALIDEKSKCTECNRLESPWPHPDVCMSDDVAEGNLDKKSNVMLLECMPTRRSG